MKNVFTTGEVAKICNVTIRTVIKWFESGELKGFKIPNSRDRRIPKENLIVFMKKHGIPLNRLDFDNKKRAKVGLPEVDTHVGAAKEIFEVTKVKEKIAGKKEAADEGEG